jgi:hypothetical protein
VLASILHHSPFAPEDLIWTFSRGFSRLTPLLENSLRHALRAYGHDVSKFDDATQTQEDLTISALFDQMRAELEAIFGKPITTDIENVFLKKPGPSLRHDLSHGLFHDGTPYGTDAIYGCWLIFQLCVIPLYPYRNQLRPYVE